MKHFLLILLLSQASMWASAQKVFALDYASQANIKVFAVEYESQADLKVFKVPYESQAGWRTAAKKHLLY
jgi:hypothetical protein